MKEEVGQYTLPEVIDKSKTAEVPKPEKRVYHYFYPDEDYYFCGKPRTNPGPGVDVNEGPEDCPECIRIRRMIRRHRR